MKLSCEFSRELVERLKLVCCVCDLSGFVAVKNSRDDRRKPDVMNTDRVRSCSNYIRLNEKNDRPTYPIHRAHGRYKVIFDFEKRGCCGDSFVCCRLSGRWCVWCSRRARLGLCVCDLRSDEGRDRDVNASVLPRFRCAIKVILKPALRGAKHKIHSRRAFDLSVAFTGIH